MRRNGMTRVVALAAVSVVASCLYAQVGVGLRDNQYVHIGYTWKEQWNVTLEHSVFSQKFSTQYVRFLLSYKQQIQEHKILYMDFVFLNLLQIKLVEYLKEAVIIDGLRFYLSD